MKKNKKILIGIIVLIAITITWYLFFKSYDYQVSFEAKTSPGTVYQGINEWSEQEQKNEKITFKNSTEIPFKQIVQKISTYEMEVQFDWNIISINDSLSKIKVGIIDTQNKFLTRLKIPFVKTDLEKFAINKLTEFKKGLDGHLRNFKIKIEGKDEISETFCAYMRIESSQANKAMNMIKNNTYISQFLTDSNLKILGYPFIEVTSWDIPNEKIIFNFCFPIEKTTNLPEHPEIKFKNISAKRAIKASYYGNYRTSDRAWYALFEYAHKEHIEIQNTPLEFFFNNPMHGGDELKWKAEVFLPLK